MSLEQKLKLQDGTHSTSVELLDLILFRLSSEPIPNVY